MNMNSFIISSQDYLSKLISSSSFDLDDNETFTVIKEPYDLAGKKYQIRLFRKLTGYLPDPEKKDEPVLYTFYILKADDETKNIFVNEVIKMQENKNYDKDIIGAYYANFVPSFKPFDQLSLSLGNMLEEEFFPGKDYEFVFHLATITKDYDIALIYLELNSLNALEAKYPDDLTLTFKQ